VDWAENALMEGDIDEKEAAAISAVVSRLGVADVRAFGLTWADCEELLSRLGYSARIGSSRPERRAEGFPSPSALDLPLCR
jgi:hypothetical protein